MCKSTEFPKVQPKYFLRHIPTAQTGYLIKGPYTPTGKPITIMIMTSQGKKYFAPVNEFESMSSPVTENQRYIHQLTRK